MRNLVLPLVLTLSTTSVLATSVNPLSTTGQDSTEVQSKAPAPATPTAIPGVLGNSYKPLGIYFSVDYEAVPDATYYEVYESNTDSNYSMVYSGNYLNAAFVHYDYGYKYYRYKACNNNGCSGLSPYRRVYVYTSPGAPNNIGIPNWAVHYGIPYDVEWTPSGGAVDGTVYTVYESTYSSPEKAVGTVTRQHWSESSYKITLSRNVSDNYFYRVQACSPQVGCGSFSESVHQLILLPNQVEEF